MRLLIRSLEGGPAPQEVQADGESTVSELLGQLSGQASISDALENRDRLVYRGHVLKASSSGKLRDLVEEGSVLVLLAGRVPAPPPRPPGARGPLLREINAAIREDLAQRGPGRVEAAEAAARQQQRAAARQVAGHQRTGLGDAPTQLLHEMMLSGESSSVRTYMEQLQTAMESMDNGGGGAAGAGPAAAVAALEALFGAQGALMGVLHEGAAATSEMEGPVGDDDDDDDGEGEAESLASALHSSYETHSDDEGEAEYTEEDSDDDDADTEEEEEVDEDTGQLPPLQVPEPDPAALAALAEMGFSDALCRNALLWGRNRFQPALDWLVGHAEDPTAAEPLSEAQLASLYGRSTAPQQSAASEQALATLQEMGFDRQQAERALQICDGMVEPAILWLLRLGQRAIAQPAPDAGGPSTEDTVAQPASAADPVAGSSLQQQREEAAASGSGASEPCSPAPEGSSNAGASGGGASVGEGAEAGHGERGSDRARGCSLQPAAERAGCAQQPVRDDEVEPPPLLADSASDGGA